MSRYYSFNDFMNDVINRANEICLSRHHVSLEGYYSVSSQTVTTIKKLIDSGWYIFVAVVALFVTGSLGLTAAIVAFLSTPPGIVVAALLGVSAFATIRKMYQEKVLPNAVRDVGKEYKSKWEMVEGNHNAIDALIESAAEDLLRKAKTNY